MDFKRFLPILLIVIGILQASAQNDLVIINHSHSAIAKVSVWLNQGEKHDYLISPKDTLGISPSNPTDTAWYWLKISRFERYDDMGWDEITPAQSPSNKFYRIHKLATPKDPYTETQIMTTSTQSFKVNLYLDKKPVVRA